MKKIISFFSILCAAALLLCMIPNLPLSADSESTAQETWTTESTVWLDGRRFSGNATESSVTEWIDSLKIKGSVV